MTILFRIVYAMHANGTHHKLALDGVKRLACTNADRWQRLFLKHAALLMQGAKAPDAEFKDFKNHVLHPGDDYWGGAPEKVANWYSHLVEAIEAHDWPQVAWCAGVLSHYYTDPIHPFHTAQSEAENNIHRAAEWSISRAYDGLLAEGEAANPDLAVAIPDGPHWIEDFVCQGADTSHRYYEKLIAHYDITRGVSDPPAGLDPIARRLIGKLLVYASTGFARLLERAIAESNVTPPDVALTAETVIATLKVPLKWVLKRMADAEERRLVSAMYDELEATGTVEVNLPDDDRMVRGLHAKEVVAPRAATRAEARVRRLSASRTSPPKDTVPAAMPATAAGPFAEASAANRNGEAEPPDISIDNAPAQRATAAPSRSTPQPSLRDALASLSFEPRRAPAVAPAAAQGEPQPGTIDAAGPAENSVPRIYLRGGDDIEAAPSIGPKTAERLIAVGLSTVSDLLAADPVTTATGIGARHITPETITDWQDQARLVMSIPGLRGTHAQLLVGAGLRSVDAIAAAEPAALSAAILRFATTRDGERILRSGDPPDIEKIKAWIENAMTALAA